MPVIVLIVSTLFFWGIYWFVRMGGLDHFREQSARRKDEARRVQARKSEQIAPLRAVDDPRNAAMILMLLIPRGRDPTESQIALIEEAMHGVFEFGHDAHEHLTQAQFMAGRAQSFAQAAGIFANMFNTRLTADERRQLVGLVEKVALIDGPSAAQTADIDALKRMVGVAPL
jgi:hypothetical protein